ncbi:mxaK protein [Paraburkholderia sp. GAS448]|uniref:tetratricopeptide repeat protein n=1 Tax=Paraburkholderia sp. GAS448 TaxID=3035136 RepID=UPI003D19F2E6
MRRASIHIAFGAIALACAAVAGYDWARLVHVRSVAQTVASISAGTGDKPHERGEVDDAPEVRLALAVALSKAGAYADAQKRFDGLIQNGGNGAIERAALFDLGNMYLRQATEGGAAGLIKSLPMLEQAKERYRALLRVSPDDWDARYNLERALWLAPETNYGSSEPDVQSQHNVTVRGAKSEDLP